MTYENNRNVFVLANKIHLTEETKQLLDQTGRFLIEKRGKISIKVRFVHN